MEGTGINPARGEITSGVRIAPVRCEVGHDIDRVGSDSNWRAEVDLLPAGTCFIGKRGRGEQGAIGIPQMADVWACVRRTLVEADAADRPRHVGFELNTEFDGAAVISRCDCRSGGTAEQRILGGRRLELPRVRTGHGVASHVPNTAYG